MTSEFGYCMMSESEVSILAPMHEAVAMMMRSQGSACNKGSAVLAKAISSDIGTTAKP